MMSIIILLAPQWWYSFVNIFSIIKSVNSKVLVLSTGIEIVLVDLNACACLHVIYFDLTSGTFFFFAAISLVSSRFVLELIFVDWLVDGFFRSVFIS